MPATTISPTSRRAFTLTELLVVIAIIAILVSLVSVGVMAAMARAKATRIKVELDQIDMAMRKFKDQYGAYPPCDLRVTDPTAMAKLRQFVATAFPRYNLNDLQNDITYALDTGAATPTFRPDRALVFWLRGFSSDPLHPFVNRNDFPLNGTTTPGTTKVTRTPIFEMDTTRLVAIDDTGNPSTTKMFSYFPQGRPADANAAPYVYWDSRSYGDISVNPPLVPLQFNSTGTMIASPIQPFANAGTATPYAADLDPAVPGADAWQNADSFQLISAGVDGKYGKPNANYNEAARVFPTGAGYDTSTGMLDDDNASNFCDSAKIGDKKP